MRISVIYVCYMQTMLCDIGFVSVQHAYVSTCVRVRLRACVRTCDVRASSRVCNHDSKVENTATITAL